MPKPPFQVFLSPGSPGSQHVVPVLPVQGKRFVHPADVSKTGSRQRQPPVVHKAGLRHVPRLPGQRPVDRRGASCHGIFRQNLRQRSPPFPVPLVAIKTGVQNPQVRIRHRHIRMDQQRRLLPVLRLHRTQSL